MIGKRRCDMICAETGAAVATCRKARVGEKGPPDRFLILRSRANAAPSQPGAARTTTAIERLDEAFRRRFRTRTALPCAETVPMLVWPLLASGQICMRKVGGWGPSPRPSNPSPLSH